VGTAKQLGVGSSSLVFEERYPDPKTGSRTVAVKRIYKKPRGIRIKEVELFVREVENFAWMSQVRWFM